MLQPAAGVALVANLNRVFRVAAPLFKSMKKGKFGTIVETIVAVAPSFKGKKFTEIFSHVKNILRAARDLRLKTKAGIKIYAKLYKVLEDLPNGLRVKRVREGVDSTKIAVIGRKMPGVVDDTVEHLGKSDIHADKFVWTDKVAKNFKKRVSEYQREVGDPTARLPFDEVKKTMAYAENKAWIKERVQKGYTILDMGDPLNSNASEGLSAFYELEKIVVFGK